MTAALPQAVAWAPWWRRAIAAIIDTALIFGLSSALLALMGEQPLWTAAPHLSVGQAAARIGTALVSTALYYPTVMLRTNGQTLGKALLRIRVVRADGERMTLARAAAREVLIKVALLDILNLVPVAGGAVGLVASFADVLWPLGDRENRALHDMLARTRVVRPGG